jgi:DNA-binding MarR family transcriptional regulator
MRFTRRLRHEAGDDLSPSLVSVLACLERKGPLTLGELAVLERVKPPSVTRMVAALESKGLVRRDADPTDGRVSHVSVTADGSRTLQISRTRKTAYLARRLTTLSDADAAALAEALSVLERLLETER